MEEKSKSESIMSNKAQMGPCLFFYYRRGEAKSNIYFDITKWKHNLMNSEYIPINTCFPTCQGWLLMIHHSKTKCSFLLDLINKVRIDLPRFKSKIDSNMICSLSSSPNKSENCCTILCLDIKFDCIYFCRPGDKIWNKHKCNLRRNKLIDVVSSNGNFYGLTLDYNFATIQCYPNPNVNVMESLNIRMPLELEHCSSYLVDSCGEIYFLQRYYLFGFPKTFCFVVMKRDEEEEEKWSEVDNIKGRVIFLGCFDFAVSWSAEDLKVKGDCIYYVEEEDDRLYCYDIEEGCISVHVVVVPSAKCDGLTPLWMLPAI